MPSVLKQFGKKNGWKILKAFSAFSARIPLWFNYGLGWIVGSLFYCLDGKKRNIALNSLQTAFPAWSVKQRSKVARAFFVVSAQSYLEMQVFLRKRNLLDNVDVVGRHHLDRALSMQRGVIGLTGHFGNFTLMHYKLAQLGYPVAVVTRPMKNKKANDYFHKIRDGIHVKSIYTIPKVQATAHIIKSLRKNDLVIIQMDQDFRESGIWVDFFNRPASTAAGPVVFALRTNAVIVPMFIVRNTMGRHTIHIKEPYVLAEKQTKDETIKDNVQQLTAMIEDWVRAYPSQWGWVNDRWKTPPPRDVIDGTQAPLEKVREKF